MVVDRRGEEETAGGGFLSWRTGVKRMVQSGILALLGLASPQEKRKQEVGDSRSNSRRRSSSGSSRRRGVAVVGGVLVEVVGGGGRG